LLFPILNQYRHKGMSDFATEPNPASRKQMFLAMSGIAASAVVVAFDATIISTSLPNVVQALGGMAFYAWVGTGYFLASAITILIFGRLGDLFGRKPLMIISMSIVTVGSVLGGLSQSMEQLIIFRVIQGLGGGMMIASTFAAPADLFPDPKRRVRWMLMTSITFATASGFGPVIGGAITQELGWRAAFFVTPLAAVVGIITTWLYFPWIKPKHVTPLKLDWLGALLVAIGIGAPLVGLELLTAKGNFSINMWGLGVVVVGIFALFLLVPVERHATTPIFPLRILRTKEARDLNLAGLLAGAVMFILIFYMPLLLQDSFGFTPTHAGLLMTPLVAGTSIGSIVNGRLFSKLKEPGRLMVFGSILLSIGCLLTLTFSTTSPDWWILLSMSLCGFGLGFLLPNFTLFMQMLAEQRDVGIASALIQTTRALGSAFGTALVGVIISYLPISLGIKIGLALCVAAGLLIALVCARIHMRNFSTS
jgi:EmrB/QacA subfamily drug resistance transporter